MINEKEIPIGWFVARDANHQTWAFKFRPVLRESDMWEFNDSDESDELIQVQESFTVEFDWDSGYWEKVSNTGDGKTDFKFHLNLIILDQN